MAIYHFNKKMKKGQSLVEVMVAMFVMMVVFVSMATLIIQSLNLVMVSRTRTEVTALAQRAMSNSVMKIKTSCPVVPPTGLPKSTDLKPDYASEPNLAKFKTINETISAIGASDQPVPVDFSVTNLPASYYKITVTVTWRDKGATSDATYSVTQLVSQAVSL